MIFFIYFLFFGPFLVLGPLQKSVNAPNVGAILKKIFWNPILYKMLGKLLNFHANWIMNKKVIKRKPTGGAHCDPRPQTE